MNIFDASAVFAHLKKETGWEVVEELMEDSVVSAANYAEVLAKLVRRGDTPKVARNILDLLELHVVPVTEEIANAAADFAAPDLGLPIGDQICLATARIRGGTAVTADSHWGRIKLDVPLHLIR